MSGFGGVILAGGRSRRMGQDKSLMRLGGRTLISRVLAVLAPLCDEVVLVTNSPERHVGLGIRMVQDALPGAGSLGGLYTGLLALESEIGAVVACDMPFLNGALLQHIAELAPGFDAVVPDLSVGERTEAQRTAKQSDLHPLHAVYRRTCLQPIAEQVRLADLRMIGFFDRVQVRYLLRTEAQAIDPELRSFFNVNSPQEWAEAERLAGSES